MSPCEESVFTYFFLVFLPVLRQNFVKFTNKSLKNCLKFNISSQKFEFIESKFTELVTPDIKIETLGSDIVKNFKNEFINIFKNKRAWIKANILRFKKNMPITCSSINLSARNCSRSSQKTGSKSNFNRWWWWKWWNWTWKYHCWWRRWSSDILNYFNKPYFSDTRVFSCCFVCVRFVALIFLI